MRYYEIIFLVHPDQTDQVPQMIKRYSDLVTSDGGTVDRLEDWGRRALAYSVQKLHKAHYVLMNVTCTQDVLDKLKGLFAFNDAVLRHLITRCESVITSPSPVCKEREDAGRDRDKRKAEASSEAKSDPD